jgi:WD repeat-containing protein 35
MRSQRIFLNCDGLQMALVDLSGHLSVAFLSTSSMKTSTIRKYDRKDVWNVSWARDKPNIMAIMEKTRMYGMRNGELKEPVISSGYFAFFKVRL